MKSKIWICVALTCLLFSTTIDASRIRHAKHSVSGKAAGKTSLLRASSSSDPYADPVVSAYDPNSPKTEPDQLPPILVKSWVSYFETSQKASPQVFKKNPAFYKAKKGDNPKDAEGNEPEVPDDILFWFLLSEEGIHVLRSRHDELKQSVNFMPLEFIRPKIKDLGQFKEGACFRLNLTSVAGSGPGAWSMCFRESDEKYTWMSYIQKLYARRVPYDDKQLQSQTEEESINSAYFPEHQVDDQFYSSGSGQVDEFKHPTGDFDEEPDRDGRWIVLQEWSTCSLACGGGTQTMQRLCIPPTGNGKPCDGESLVTKSCNEHPCQDAEITVTEKVEQTAAPIVRITPISSRPQRYDECELKEGDMEMVREDMTDFPRPPRVPVRVIMNNRTISAFGSDSYDSLQYTFELENLSPILNYAEDKESCMIISDDTPNKRMVLCGLAVSNQAPKESKEEWIRDIEYFQHYCREPALTTTPPDEYEFSKKQSQLKMNYLDEQAQHDLEKEQSEKEAALDEDLIITQNEANRAIEKELKYEAAAEREERLRNEAERSDLQKALEDAKEKMRCMEAAITDKELQEERNTYHLEVEKKKDEIKEETKTKVERRRAQIKRRMKIIQELHHRQNMALQSEISQIQNQMTQKLADSNKEGDMSLCSGPRPQSYRDEYCDKHYQESYQENKECKSSEDFCYVCCETEFGESQKSKRAVCDQQCGPQASTDKKEDGQWVWVNESNTVSSTANAKSSRQALSPQPPIRFYKQESHLS